MDGSMPASSRLFGTITAAAAYAYAYSLKDDVDSGSPS